MKSFKFAVIAAAAMFLASGVQAAPIDITAAALNYASFEYPTDTYPSGTTVGSDWNPNASGMWTNCVSTDSKASDGNRIYGSNSGEEITQHVDASVTVQANAIYTLNVDIGDSNSDDDPLRVAQGTIELFVHTAAQSGGAISGTQGTDWDVATTNFYSDTGTVLNGLADDQWTVTLNTNDAAFSPFVGGTMSVRLHTDNVGYNYPVADDVRLFENIIPEPSTLVLLGIGALSLLLVLRRRLRG